MIIPKEGDWAVCQNIYDQVKVERVDLDKQKFYGMALTESGHEEGGGGENVEIDFDKITEIIVDEKLISKLENELKGGLKND